MCDIYKHPEQYDLEHSGHEEDTEFYLGLLRTLRPHRVLELGCGTGRITLPLAREGGGEDFEVVGLDNEPEMLRRAEQSRTESDPDTWRRLSYVRADMLSWRSEMSFDLNLDPVRITQSHPGP